MTKTRRKTSDVVRLCEHPGCDKPYRAKGLCAAHYSSYRYFLHEYVLSEPISADPSVRLLKSGYSNMLCCDCGMQADMMIGIRAYCFIDGEDRWAPQAFAQVLFAVEEAARHEDLPDWWPIELLRDTESTCDMPDEYRQTLVSYKTAKCIYCDTNELRCVPRAPGRIKGYICEPCVRRRDQYAGQDGFCPVCGADTPPGIGGRTRLYCDRHIKRNSNIRRYPKEASLQAVLERDDWTCHLCGDRIIYLEDATRDHLVPKSHGGSDELDNLKAAHMVCNSRRHAKPLGEMESV